jgi:hypothetical protein
MEALGFIAIFYLLPLAVAFAINRERLPKVAAITLLTGWTIIGWGVAFGLALARSRATIVPRSAKTAEKNDWVAEDYRRWQETRTELY